jgi:hypothetical protein
MKTAKQEFLDSILKKGELYAGIIIGKDGDPDYHLILLANKEEYANWETAKELAAKAGGHLPTCREQSLLSTNLNEEFQGRHYWSSEQHASNSGYAWRYNFYDRRESNYSKHVVLNTRAVRRVVI